MITVKEFDLKFSVPGVGELPVVWRCWLDRNAYVSRYELLGETSALESLGLELSGELEELEAQWGKLLMRILQTLPEESQAKMEFKVGAYLGENMKEVTVYVSTYEIEECLHGDFHLEVENVRYDVPTSYAPESFMNQLVAHGGPLLRCCGTCAWFDECIYGGTDEWVGAYCFVKSGEMDCRVRWDTSQVVEESDWDRYPHLADKQLLSPFYVCDKWQKNDWLDKEEYMASSRKSTVYKTETGGE